MWRYLLIATAIVFVAGGIVAALHLNRSDLRVASVQTTASPSPPRAQAPSTLTPGPITGNAPWIFNTLLDCFRHEATFEGPLESVRGHVPAGAVRFRPDEVLESGSCVARLDTADSGRVVRKAGEDTVIAVIPPHVEIYIEGGPRNPAGFGKRRVYVLRWKHLGDARLDRLSTMDFARVEHARL